MKLPDGSDQSWRDTAAKLLGELEGANKRVSQLERGLLLLEREKVEQMNGFTFCHWCNDHPHSEECVFSILEKKE